MTAPNDSGPLTIDDLVATLARLRQESPLGGETVIVVTLVGSGVPDCVPTSARLDTDPTMRNVDGTCEPNGVVQLLVPSRNHEVRE